MFDLILKSKCLVTPGGMMEGSLCIKGGIITDVVTESFENPAVVDLCDSVVLPGLIDPHVHINEPGRTDWEGFEAATRAALAGGLTLLADMPLNSSPVTTTVAAFDKKLAAAAGKLFTNCGFWGGVVPGNEGEIEGLIQRGVLGFKAFLTHSGIDDFPNVTESDLRKVMPLIARHGLPLLVHCELADDTPLPVTDNRSYRQYLSSRPRRWEEEAIDLMIRLCAEYLCPVHIVHVSAASSLEAIRRARAQGLPLTAETAQHYLFFSAEEIADGQTQFKCAPPIRERGNNDRLWQALEEGVLDFVATDHSPAPPELKQLESGNFSNAWGGIASLQFALPALWTAARRHGHTLPEVVRWLSEAPARLTGQQARKGKLEKGFDADIVVFKPEERFVVREEGIHHRHKVTPYLGKELTGVVAQTYLGGQLVYENGTFAQGRQGTVVRREQSAK
ncbi:allantoinase AllB [Paraflavisolibacter sp. H34]|uniref:allantoinase AllB n=1 Tax=Huijunlia imazamoxiresistens TaxID=3127457 RepID=UPI0030164A83